MEAQAMSPSTPTWSPARCARMISGCTQQRRHQQHSRPIFKSQSTERIIGSGGEPLTEANQAPTLVSAMELTT